MASNWISLKNQNFECKPNSTGRIWCPPHPFNKGRSRMPVPPVIDNRVFGAYLTVTGAGVDATPVDGSYFYSNGTYLTLSAGTTYGYSYVGYTGTGSVPSTGNTDYLNFTINQASTINWLSEGIPMTLTVINAGNGATLSAGTYTYSYGTPLYVTAGSAPAGLRCSGYTGTGNISNGTNLYVSFNLTQNSTITWDFVNGYTGYTSAALIRDFSSWSAIATFPSFARDNNFRASLDNIGYLGCGSNWYAGGGYGVLSAMTKEFWKYEPIANTWTQLADFGGGVRFAGVMQPANGSLYAGFGASGSTPMSIPLPGLTYFNDWWKYTVSSNTWTQMASCPAVARYSMCSFVIGNDIYIGGGGNAGSNSLRDFWRYNTTADTWTQIANYPATVPNTTFVQQNSFSLNGYGYVGCSYSRQFSKYDPTTNSWGFMANYYYQPIAGGTFVYDSNTAYILGGDDAGPRNMVIGYASNQDFWAKSLDYTFLAREDSTIWVLSGSVYAGFGVNFYPIVSQKTMYKANTTTTKKVLNFTYQNQNIYNQVEATSVGNPYSIVVVTASTNDIQYISGVCGRFQGSANDYVYYPNDNDELVLIAQGVTPTLVNTGNITGSVGSFIQIANLRYSTSLGKWNCYNLV